MGLLDKMYDDGKYAAKKEKKTSKWKKDAKKIKNVEKRRKKN